MIADTNLNQVLKRLSMETMIASKPCDIFLGKVMSASPLKISISQKLTLTSEFLELCEHLTSYSTKITIDGTTSTVTVHNQLQKGDKVVLIRKLGGQKYLILDKVVSG